MSVPLLPSSHEAAKADTSGYVGPNRATYEENVRKAANVEAALHVFATPRQKAEAPRPLPSNGIGQLLAGALPDYSPTPAVAAKMDKSTLHPAAKAVAHQLPENAARLLDLIIKADERHRGAQLVDVPASVAAKALSISEDDAVHARGLLERRGYIRFFDNGTGDRGFRPDTLLGAR